MSAEAFFTEGGGEPQQGPRCRYCARLLRTKPAQPDEAQTHCDNPMCNWCQECVSGKTTVSPAYRGKRAA